MDQQDQSLWWRSYKINLQSAQSFFELRVHIGQENAVIVCGILCKGLQNVFDSFNSFQLDKSQVIKRIIFTIVYYELTTLTASLDY